MAANRKETKEFQISVYFVQIKAKIIKYGFKHTECRLVYVYIMFINFIFDVHSLKHTKINRYNGTDFGQKLG